MYYRAASLLVLPCPYLLITWYKSRCKLAFRQATMHFLALGKRVVKFTNNMQIISISPAQHNKSFIQIKNVTIK